MNPDGVVEADVVEVVNVALTLISASRHLDATERTRLARDVLVETPAEVLVNSLADLALIYIDETARRHGVTTDHYLFLLAAATATRAPA